jgi:hypothetical protein
MKLLLFLLGLLASSVFSGCDDEVFSRCEDNATIEAVSPGGRYVATVFERNCGATTDYSTNVSLREAKEASDTSSQTPIFTVTGQPAIALQWSTETTLTVVVPETETFKKLDVWRDVRVAYQAPAAGLE